MLEDKTILVVQPKWLIAEALSLAPKARGANVLSAPDASTGLAFVSHPGLSAAVLNSESQEICAVLAQRNIPYLVYTGKIDVEGCDQGPIVYKPESAQASAAQVQQLIDEHQH
jgi:hypothetical protein